jgi:hypothetical protein
MPHFFEQILDFARKPDCDGFSAERQAAGPILDGSCTVARRHVQPVSRRRNAQYAAGKRTWQPPVAKMMQKRPARRRLDWPKTTLSAIPNAALRPTTRPPRSSNATTGATSTPTAGFCRPTRTSWQHQARPEARGCRTDHRRLAEAAASIPSSSAATSPRPNTSASTTGADAQEEISQARPAGHHQ